MPHRMVMLAVEIKGVYLAVFRGWGYLVVPILCQASSSSCTLSMVARTTIGRLSVGASIEVLLQRFGLEKLTGG